jgi:hypothetical protein
VNNGGAAPEGFLAETSEDGGINAGQANHNACVGCGARTDDSERVCIACRHTDAVAGTFVIGVGDVCPICGAEGPAP